MDGMTFEPDNADLQLVLEAIMSGESEYLEGPGPVSMLGLGSMLYNFMYIERADFVESGRMRDVEEYVECEFFDGQNLNELREL